MTVHELQDLNKMAVTQQGRNHFLWSSGKIHDTSLHISFPPTALLQQKAQEKCFYWVFSYGFTQATIWAILIVLPF